MTPIPGTTRDVLEVSVDLGGVPVLVSDTAGLREATDTVESIGIARARSAVESADLRLLVLSLPDVLDEGGKVNIDEEDIVNRVIDSLDLSDHGQKLHSTIPTVATSKGIQSGRSQPTRLRTSESD